jgi:hypothetical protein
MLSRLLGNWTRIGGGVDKAEHLSDDFENRVAVDGNNIGDN